MSSERRDRRPVRDGLRAGIMALAIAGLGGCADQPELTEAPPEAPQPEPLPSYRVIADAQNQRAAMLDRLWSAASAVVTYQDQDGQVRTEQAEGYLQIIQPSNVALSLGKQITSEVYFYLGSNDDSYWWLDRLDPERKVAYIGTHAMASPERAARFGAPVHPLDLLDLLGVTPLPDPVAAPETDPPERAATSSDGATGVRPSATDADPTIPPGVRVSWSPDVVHVMVDVPGRFGTRRVWFESRTLLPRRVEILDRSGRVAVSSVLKRDVIVDVRGDSRRRPVMAESVDVSIPGTQISIRLLLSRLENRGTRQLTAPFNIEGVLRAYPVDRREDLDAIDVGEGAQPDQQPSPAEGSPRIPDRRLRMAPARPN